MSHQSTTFLEPPMSEHLPSHRAPTQSRPASRNAQQHPPIQALPQSTPRKARAALRVLVVQSGGPATESLVLSLLRHGYQAISVDTGSEALRKYREADVLLLDLDLPDLDGIEICRSVRAASGIGAIVVTARDTELDRVLSLKAGADDYVIKPYSLPELMARIEAVMRRVRPLPLTSEVITSGPLRIDARTREIRLDDQPVDVTRKEFDLLYLLASRPESVISREQIMTLVWGDSRSRPGRTIDTHVSSLRSKLGSSNWIITARGVGFRFGHA
ncbi:MULTISPECIES: response regulator transcription factor [Streptomyces]|uniref:Sensory transduction protein RegX3 n=1 Tax=Streptomyces dengpaensis TaxID=2049881 RepID=A0ABM6SMU1_9ACTN|nr:MULTISPECIES: response regulator transcription factor [Streptomyces]AVH55976.1 DNA-binding response regulator [Streptomyces dengpaensis]PIB12225.1 DNA-binding response regulator [Streptomyces sp. HG99]